MPAYRNELGDVVMLERGKIVGTLKLPCGQCVGCRLERSRQWAARIMHEAASSRNNAFITLTYDEANIPQNGSLQYSDYQLFMKRLRKHFEPKKIRFYMCGEYGEQLQRPHYHAAIFNEDFCEDRKPWTKRRKHQVWRSKTLEKLWPHGQSEIGELTNHSAGYMARYIMKKITGDLADIYYSRIDEQTGEVIHLTPEFTHMSLKPGIGAQWYEKYTSSVFPHDRIIIKGKQQKPPRYYDKLLKRQNRIAYEQIKDDRNTAADTNWQDNTETRLLVKETVTKAKVRYYKRPL